MNETVPRIVAETRRRAEARRRRPSATYRLQMHSEFTLRDALAVVPYLHALGVSHIYTSSLLMARPASRHGYDIVDHSRLNPELGTDDDLSALTDELHARRMGLILDVVPNHMCVNGPNAWWNDVLEHGPSSPWANHFDIAWDDHPRESLRGKVLLPVLGERYGQILESGQFQPVFDAGAFRIQLGEARLPIDPRTYGRILNPVLDETRVRLGAASEVVLELQSIVMAVSHLAPRYESDAASVREGLYEISVVKRRLSDLVASASDVAEILNLQLQRIAGIPGDRASFAALDEWIAAQAYRPAFWRVASDEINYRRFFDVNDLAAICVEREGVFQATHGLVLEWVAAGIVDGLRIDHPDGLFDPREYLERLQLYYLLALAKRVHAEESGENQSTWDELVGELKVAFEPMIAERFLYIVVEKILAPNEKLPADWPTDGATGYEFLAQVNAALVDPRAEIAMSQAYADFAGPQPRYDELVYRNKFLILQSSLAGELHVLAHQIDRLAQMDRGSRDFTLNTFRHALRELIAGFPVYRSYIAKGTVSVTDAARITREANRARRRNPLLGRALFDFIRDTLLLKDPPSGPATPAYRSAQEQFAGHFQQVTSPVMAKGVEDTTFYVYHRLVSLNEVGGEPGHFGATANDLHRFLAERAAATPFALSTLSTHDTKRDEDVRMRIHTIAYDPTGWRERARRWSELNRDRKLEIDEQDRIPGANEEYLIYQTLVGTWPADGRVTPEYTRRIGEYMNKVVHEAKVHSSWIHPDAEYDAAIGEFVKRILDPEQSAEFHRDIGQFAATLRPLAARLSLAQTLIRCTAPGVPDTYQGTELWGDSLVDPDNRRPVDYGRSAKLLNEIIDAAPAFDSDAAKLFVVSRTLRFRREHPELFRDYLPIPTGNESGFAYLRHNGADAVVVVVDLRGAESVTVPPLPEDWEKREWFDHFGDSDFPVVFRSTIAPANAGQNS